MRAVALYNNSLLNFVSCLDLVHSPSPGVPVLVSYGYGSFHIIMMLYNVRYPKINVVCMCFHCALSFAFLHVVHLYNKIRKLHSVLSCWLTLIWLILGQCLIVSSALPLTSLQIQLPCHSSAVILLSWRLPRSWDRCLNVLTTVHYYLLCL